MTSTISDQDLIEGKTRQRADTFTFRLLNPNRTPMGGELKAHADSPPTLQVQTTRTSFRTLSGLTVEDPPLDLDIDRARVQPILTLSNGTQHALGVLMFGTLGRNIYAGSEVWQPELFDETFLLDQGLDRTWTIQQGGSVLTAFVQMAGEVLDPLGIPADYRVSDVPASQPITHRVGKSRQTALGELAALLGALPPYFANAGAHTLKPPPTLGAFEHVYGMGTRIFDQTTTLSSNRYKAPNRYIVVGADVNGTPIRGVFDLPAAAPNSYANTGRIVTADLHTVPGVTSEELANQIAYVDALTDRNTYSTATFSAAADPRHDTFGAVKLLDLGYVETGWSLTCESGGAHAHTCSAVFA